MKTTCNNNDNHSIHYYKFKSVTDGLACAAVPEGFLEYAMCIMFFSASEYEDCMEKISDEYDRKVSLLSSDPQSCGELLKAGYSRVKSVIELTREEFNNMTTCRTYKDNHLYERGFSYEGEIPEDFCEIIVDEVDNGWYSILQDMYKYVDGEIDNAIMLDFRDKCFTEIDPVLYVESIERYLWGMYLHSKDK